MEAPAFPRPIGRVLQVRNRMTQHEAIAPDAALDLTVRTATGATPSDAVVRRHPLQPFDAANFRTEESRPFSFDQAALRGARAAARERTGGPEVYPTAPLPERVRDTQVELADLVRQNVEGCRMRKGVREIDVE